MSCGGAKAANALIVGRRALLPALLAMAACMPGSAILAGFPGAARAASGLHEGLPPKEAVGDVVRGPNGRIVPRDPSMPRENRLGKGRLIRVGPGQSIRVPSEAARIARDGDVVEIEAGVYRGDVAVWRQNDLTLRGVGGRPHLDAAGKSAEGKAIWVIAGTNVLVQNIEFSGATVHDRNGAGIKYEGRELKIAGCYFHDNEDGLLTSNIADAVVTVERSEFARNGEGDGYSHNIYIGKIRRFTLRYSYSHDAHVGHVVKSRAQENFILYNRLADEENGDSSYVLDLSQGGTAYLVGNIIQQGRRAINFTAVSFAAEGPRYPSKGFYVVNNTLANEHPGGTLVRNRDPAVTATLINNLILGPGTVLEGRGTTDHDLVNPPHAVRSLARRDYHLVAGSPAIGAGIRPPKVPGFDLMPVAEYAAVAGSAPRKARGRVDVGAYAFTP